MLIGMALDALGISSAWWTISGLVCDIAGVTLVAKNWTDLLRRYSKKRAVRMIEEALEDAHQYRKQAGLSEETKFSASSELSPIRARLRDLTLKLIKAPFLILGKEDLWPEVREVVQRPDATAADIDAAFEPLVMVVEELYQPIPSLDLSSIALALILGGFLLQIIGSWPG